MKQLSSAEFDRLVMLFRKEGVTDHRQFPPENMAALMVNNTPAVARKWLEEENLLDKQQQRRAWWRRLVRR